MGCEPSSTMFPPTQSRKQRMGSRRSARYSVRRSEPPFLLRENIRRAKGMCRKKASAVHHRFPDRSQSNGGGRARCAAYSHRESQRGATRRLGRLSRAFALNKTPRIKTSPISHRGRRRHQIESRRLGWAASGQSMMDIWKIWGVPGHLRWVGRIYL